jgi:hypothetical protein
MSIRYLQPHHQEIFNHNHTLRPKDIMAIEKANGNDISYKQGWRTVKETARITLGDDIESFQKLPALLERMKDADPEIHYHVSSKDGAFHQLFIAPGPSIKAFNNCCPLISLDGTFWKNQWDITLLIAVILDPNHEILPLAWGVVPSESEDHWGFF